MTSFSENIWKWHHIVVKVNDRVVMIHKLSSSTGHYQLFFLDYRFNNIQFDESIFYSELEMDSSEEKCDAEKFHGKMLENCFILNRTMELPNTIYFKPNNYLTFFREMFCITFFLYVFQTSV